MTPELVALLTSAAPAVQDVAVSLVKAIQAGDEKSTRAATEAALRLVFEARQAIPKDQ